MAKLEEPIIEILRKVGNMHYQKLQEELGNRYKSEKGNLRGFPSSIVFSIIRLRERKEVSLICDREHEERYWCRNCEIYLPEYEGNAREALMARKIRI